MKKILTKTAYGFVVAAVFSGSALYAGCSSDDDDDWNESQRQSLAARRMTRGAESVPTPPKPNPVEEIDSTIVYKAVNTTVKTEVNMYVRLSFTVTSNPGTINTIRPKVAQNQDKKWNEDVYSRVEINDVKPTVHNGQIFVTYRYVLTLQPESPNKQNPGKGHPATGFGSFSVTLEQYKDFDKDKYGKENH